MLTCNAFEDPYFNCTLSIFFKIFRYNNNKSYRIDDIDFGHNPTDTFRQGNVEISYVQYYNARHGIDITDLGQPLLINRKMMRFSGQDVKETCLIPELCHLTGLTDDQRNDFQVRLCGNFQKIQIN